MYLNCHSFYSLRFGTISPSDLSIACFSLDIDTAVLSDINNTSAIPEFYFECRKNGVKPIAGVDIRDRNYKQHYVIIARNNEGLYEINRFLSECNSKSSDYTAIPEFDNAFVIIPYENYKGQKLKEYEFVGIRPSQTRFLIKHETDLYKKSVILHSLSFKNPSFYEVHGNLRAIDRSILLSQLNDKLYSSPSDVFIHPSELRKIYSSFPRTVENTLFLLSLCSLHFDRTHKNMKMFTGSKSEDIALLRHKSFEGMKRRYGTKNRPAFERLMHELNIIQKMNFVSYFLITMDIVNFSQSRGFYHVGRGSGANSIVAYCLGITDVDPIELNLYFERFINPKRSSPPDFDIDYSWHDRDEVLRYIFRRFGKDHCALLGAMSTFKTRSVLRELAKVYGLPGNEIDILVSNPESVKNKDYIHSKIFELAAQISEFPNIRTIHAGGVIISDKPIYYYAATDLPPKGLPVTQWDMYVAEDIGFEKFDILSQRGLGHIKECIDIVRKNRGIDVDITRIDDFKKDDKVKELLSSGETLGCFYIESPAMRGLIKKLRCADYKTLVAASSIIRPGVAKSGMMKEFIIRYNNPQRIEFLHPILEEQLGETFGVMVYQEDVLKVCSHYAGMDLADADVLRRAMSGKFRSKAEFNKIRDRFFDACNEMKRPVSTSAELWRQIESFAGYSFSRAHSASYAVESYQSLYLKAYFPIEFICAVINNFGGFYASRVYFHEAKRIGAKLKKPCVNKSEMLNSVEDEKIYMGFVHIEGLEQKFTAKIIEERANNGAFNSLYNFVERLAPGNEQLNLLIKAGSFAFTGLTVPELLWQACLHKSDTRVKNFQVPPKLFYFEEPKYSLPELSYTVMQEAYNEIELLGFPVSISYFNMLKTKFRGEVKACNMGDFKNKTVRMLGLFICIKYVRTSSNDYMNFVTWTDCDGNFFDSVHFKDSLKIYPFRGEGVYLMLGKIDCEFNYPVLRVEKLAKMEFVSWDR